jgi:pyrroline-5-carboxylate reductase
VFLIIEALADAGVKVGLPRDVSWHAAQTVRGSACLVLETGKHPGLKDMVASQDHDRGIARPGAGCRPAALINAVEAATRRSGETGKRAVRPRRNRTRNGACS